MKIYLILLLLPLLVFADGPIAIWLTWQQDPTTTMTIQWLTVADDTNDTVSYHRKGVEDSQVAKATHVTLPDGYSQIVHRVELTQLSPNTHYEFSLGSHTQSWCFRTLPTTMKDTIRFVVGGDMYHDSLQGLHTTNRQAARTNPQFAVIGGDIAYSAGGLFEKEQGDRWITWLEAWYTDMVSVDGCLIPVVPAIGNHEAVGSFDQTPAQAKFFYTLFSMPNQHAYRALDFSSYLTLIFLDSGHTAPVDGEQKIWLEKTLAARKEYPNKFAIYHVPAYPSIRHENSKHSTVVRDNWVPLFDAYHLDVAFEHHDHAYKRTFPLRHNAKDKTGTLYLGDGAWAPACPRIMKTRAWYIEKHASKRHFIVVYLKEKERNFFVISDEGRLLDCVRIPTNSGNSG